MNTLIIVFFASDKVRTLNFTTVGEQHVSFKVELPSPQITKYTINMEENGMFCS